MHTDICFTNLSLNIHRPSVTIFQRNHLESPERLIAWKVIESCQYRWNHPFSIEWGYSYQLADRYGNYRAATPLPPCSDSETHRQGINISYVQEQVIFTKTEPGKYTDVLLLKNGSVIARHPLTMQMQASFLLSDAFYIGADLRAAEGAGIHVNHINASLTPFSLAWQEKLNIVMCGGQPGCASTPITFQFS